MWGTLACPCLHWPFTLQERGESAFSCKWDFFLSGWTSATCTFCLSQRRERWWAPSRESSQVENSRKQFSKPNSRKKMLFIAENPLQLQWRSLPWLLPHEQAVLPQPKSHSWQHCQGRLGCYPASKLSSATLSLSRSVFNVIHMTFVPSSQQLATQWMISYLSGKKKEQCKLLMGWHCLSLSSKKKKTWDTARSTTTQVSAVNP